MEKDDIDHGEGISIDAATMIMRDFQLTQIISHLHRQFPTEISTLIVADPVDTNVIQVVGAGSQSKQQMTMLIDRLSLLRDKMDDEDEDLEEAYW